ncbi:WASH complex subunit 2C isoform X1 [Monodelphis domestica]|uniref:WASH complex subunit 2C isoform X1 n=1 Tax=Monodelphis domestica TaxID=13616 RepID=UPI0007B41372|nr:WASH complex subunit 2C isoform X1 [Monodelphis domestica]
MSGPDPEPGPESGPGPVWERPWSLDEIRKNSQSWSLAADAGLLQFLQEFSQQTISRTHEIKKQVDGLIHETKATDCRLHNVFNDFLMLSNTQFIENRVYDEEVEEPVPKAEVEKTEQEKTREQKEADLIPKVQEAVNYGLLVLDSAFEQLDIKAGNSDSEEEEANERIELILEPKDLYIDRPLPYLIGSQLFMEQEDVGLGDLSSEEGSLNSEPDSVLDSEEEKDEEESDDDFGNQSDNDQKPHTALISDEEEEEDGCDLFGDSEKEEEEGDEDDGENARPKRNRPTSFADELAARIKGDTSRTYEGQTSKPSSGEAKPKRTTKEKKDIRKVPSDDEEDDMFKPPKLTDEDFSPFGSRGGLFSGGMGLFDDDDESDLFSEAPKDSENQTPIKEETSSSKPGKKIPAGAVSLFLGNTDVFSVSSLQSPKEQQKPPQSTQGKTPQSPVPAGLFDSSDDDFFVASNSKPLHTAKPTVDLFNDEEEEEEDLFKKKAPPSSTDVLSPEAKEAGEKVMPPSSKNLKASSEAISKIQKGLFSDEEDSEDLFSSAQNVNKTKAVPPHSSKLNTKKSLSLFDDDDEEENLFGDIPTKKQSSSVPKPAQEKAKSSEPHKKASGLLFSSDDEDQWGISDSQTSRVPDSNIKELKKPGTMQDHKEKDGKKRSLFEEDDEEDLFTVAKDSQKKAAKVSLLFEEDADSGGSLFGSPTPPSDLSAKTGKEKIPQAMPSLFSDEDEEEAPFGTVKQVDKKAESALSGSPVVDKQEEKLSSPGAHFKTTTGVFQDEELLFSHKLQQDNDPDVDLFATSSGQRTGPPSKEALFGDEEDDDFFTSAQPRPPKVPQKKIVVKKDNFGPPFENHKLPESSPSSKPDTDVWKPETAQDSASLPPYKTKEPSSRIGKLQADLAINPAALLPGAAPKISGVKPTVPAFGFATSEPDGVRGVETASAGEMGVSFEDPARADTLHSVNKGRIKMKGKRRPQTRTARRLAAQESSETEDRNDAEEPQLVGEHVVSSFVKQQHTREVDKKENLEKTFGVPSPFLEDAFVPGGERDPSSRSVNLTIEDSLFDSDDIFAKASMSKSTTKRTKDKESPSEDLATHPGDREEKQSLLPVLDEPENDDDLFQSVKQKLAKKKNTVPLLEEEDDLFVNQKTKKKTSEPLWQQDVISKKQDIFEDDIFATEAIRPAQKTKDKEKALESSLFDDNIDIFADLTVKPKEKKSKKKVEPKSIFDDEMDDIFSSSGPTKMPKPKSQSAQSTPETRSETKVSGIFDDPLNALGGQ